MKTIAAILVVVVAGSYPGMSQKSYPAALQKGSVLTGGILDISFGSSSSKWSDDFDTEEYKSTYQTISLTPTIARFFGDGIVLGVLVDVTSTSYKDQDDDSKVTMSQFSVGPMFRYYAPGGFFVHGEVSVGQNTAKFELFGDSGKESSNLLKWKLGIGYAFLIDDHISFEPSISYRKTKSTSDEQPGHFEEKLGEFVIGAGFNIFLYKNGDTGKD